MQLDDLKNNWQAVAGQVNKQHSLTPKMIDNMTRKKFSSTLNKIRYPELAGTVICLLLIIYIIMHFNRFSVLYLQMTAVITMFLLLFVSVLSIIGITRFTAVDNTYAEALKHFAIQKLRFKKLQQVNIFCSYLLLVGTIVISPSLFKAPGASVSNYFWVLAFPLGYLYLTFMLKLMSRMYGKSLTQAEELLKELQ